MKTCPYCAEEIQDAAIKCKHCGERLDEQPRSNSDNEVAVGSNLYGPSNPSHLPESPHSRPPNRSAKRKWSESNWTVAMILAVGLVITFNLVLWVASDDQNPNLRDSSATLSSNKKPEASPWDGSVYEVKLYLENRLRDPESVVYEEWGEIEEAHVSGEEYWRVPVWYRAKNGFGGYVKSFGVALMQDGEVVRWVEE